MDSRIIIQNLIKVIGDNPYREGLIDTPDRVLKSYKELFAGYQMKPEDILDKTFRGNGEYNEMILVKDIQFTSFCEHHLLPFLGVAHVAYIPQSDKVYGLSKLARLVDCYSKRLQVQERITVQVVDALMKTNPGIVKGAGCVISATHMCMSCRGVKKDSAVTVTSALRGVFSSDPSTRSEFLSLCR